MLVDPMGSDFIDFTKVVGLNFVNKGFKILKWMKVWYKYIKLPTKVVCGCSDVDTFSFGR